MHTSPRRVLLDWATIVLFGAALCAPALDQLVRPDEARDTVAAERRGPEPRPVFPRSLLELTAFPRRFEAHYQDTFGLRDVLLQANAVEHWFGLRRSPSRLVEPAAQGWCFLGGDSRGAHRGLRPFNTRELDGWVRRLRERRDFLAARGIRYLFVLCPNKETIYPERVPTTWSRVGPTRLEQLALRLADEPDLPFLDLRPALNAAKAGDQTEDWVYTRFGTHWNGRGGYAAYRALVERLQQDFPALELVSVADCRAVEATASTESLANQLYLGGRIRQRQYALELPGRSYDVQLPSGHADGAKLVTRKDLDAPRLLWLHDSFGPFLEALLCESFSFVQAHWTQEFPVDALYEARPDVVLETYVERVLVEQEPYRPIDTQAEPPEASFERATDVAWRADAEFSGVEAFGEAQVERSAGELRVHLDDKRGGVLLPALELAPGSLALLCVSADCAEVTEIDVFVRPVGALSFVRKNHTRSELGPDAQTTVLRLPFVGPSFETLVRFQTPSGGLSLRDLEVRRARPSAH